MLTVDDYARLKTELESVLVNVGTFLGELVEAPSGGDNDSHVVIDQQLQHFFKSYYKLKKRHDDDALSVAVLALTKSGKSTLLNALISSECLPVNNVPETARICKIVHTPCSEPFLDDTPKVVGAREIKHRLQCLNQEVRARESPRSSSEKVLHIRAPITALQGAQDHGTNLYLVDTPGPNEAGEEGLRFQVERLLDSVDAVIYLLDYTKLKTAEEEDVLKRLKSINPQLIQRLSQRLFFVVNKADQAMDSEGLSTDETRIYVSQLITRQLACDGFHLLPEQVLLLSARNAFLSRLVLTGKASDDMHQRFVRLAFGNYSSVKAPPEQVKQAAQHMLRESGIEELEAKVLSFLYAHSAAVKMLATVDDVVRLLQEVWNVVVSYRACLEQNVEALTVHARELRRELQLTLKSFDDVLRNTEQLQAEVGDEIRQHLGMLRTKLFTYICQTLDTEGISGPTSNPPTWRRIRDKFVSLFTSGGVAKSKSREEMQKLLTDVHNDLMRQIENEVGEFWHILESCTKARHGQLLREVNGHLAKLSREVENVVSSALDIQLEPVNIALQLPSAEQLHSNLQELIQKGIDATQEKHIRVGQKEYKDRVLRFRTGLCKMGPYWEDVARTRTVVETYNVTMYQLKPQEIQDHFIELVDKAIENSQRALHLYVQQYIDNNLAAARGKIEDYSDRYLSAMTNALEVSAQGTDHRMSALDQVTCHLSTITALKGRALMLQQNALSHVPQLQDACDYETDFDDTSETEDESSYTGLPADNATDQPTTPLVTADGSEHQSYLSGSPHSQGSVASSMFSLDSRTMYTCDAAMCCDAALYGSQTSDSMMLTQPGVGDLTNYSSEAVRGMRSHDTGVDAEVAEEEEEEDCVLEAAVPVSCVDMEVGVPAAAVIEGGDEGNDESAAPPMMEDDDDVDVEDVITGVVAECRALIEEAEQTAAVADPAVPEDGLAIDDSDDDEEEAGFRRYGLTPPPPQIDLDFQGSDTAGDGSVAESEDSQVPAIEEAEQQVEVPSPDAPAAVVEAVEQPTSPVGAGFMQVHVHPDSTTSPVTCFSLSSPMSPSIASCLADEGLDVDTILESGSIPPATDAITPPTQGLAHIPPTASSQEEDVHALPVSQTAGREVMTDDSAAGGSEVSHEGTEEYEDGALPALPATSRVEEVYHHDDDGPFDYSAGFARAMSTSHLLEDPSCSTSEEDWQLVDDSVEA